jgi:PAS domain S-box-containing protein
MARALLNAVTDVAALMEPDGTIVALNVAAATRLGKGTSSLIGTCVFDLFPPDVAAHRRAKCDQAFHSGQPVHFTDQRGGRWFDHTIYPALDSHGQVTRLAIFARDTTERRRAIRAMRRQAERLRVMHRVDTAILAAQSPEEITKTVLEHLRPLVFYLGAGVMLFDFEAHEGIVLYAEAASTTQIPPGTRWPLDLLPGVGVAIEALEQGEIYTTEKIQAANTIPVVQFLRAEGMRAALAVPLIAQDELIGLFALVSDRLDAFGESQIRTVREFADPLAIALQQARLFQSVKQHREQLRALSIRLAEADETERRRLARELHDQVGQNLTALGINLNLMRTHLPQETSGLVRDRLDDSLALVEETTARVRLVMAELRPPMLDDFGLVATLQWHGARFASHLGINVTVTGEEPVPRLAAQTENALFRIAQEALTNVAKHAQATQVTIAMKADHKIVRLMIADDGVGFDPASPARPDGDRGWGLITMAERAEAVGGHCRIESKRQQGTRVIVEVTR